MAFEIHAFTNKQLFVIAKAKELDISDDMVDIFAQPYFSSDQMNVIKNCLLKNYDFRWVQYFSVEENKVDFLCKIYKYISLLINYRLSILIDYNMSIGHNEMVNKYKKYIIEPKKISDDQDTKEYWKKNKYDIEAIVDTNIKLEHIKRLCYLIKKGFEFDFIVKGIFLKQKDFEILSNLNLETYQSDQIECIVDGMAENVDYSTYISSDFSAKIMRLIFEALKFGVEPKKIRDNIWINSNETDINRLIREKNAYQTNKLSYQVALKKYKDEEIRRCVNCEDYFSVKEFWDLNIDNSLCTNCFVKAKQNKKIIK